MDGFHASNDYGNNPGLGSTDEIRGYLQKKISKRSIAKLIECSPSSLYAWLKKRRINIR
ncbi:MAG: hypothetical protein ACK50V_04205 [Alphaproteobacteria bacterium]|jgi:hypothetical protein